MFWSKSSWISDIAFKNRSGMPFKSYEKFTKDSIADRVELYKAVLRWEFENN